MAGEVANVPLGLISLLGLRGMGETPRVVQPNVDVSVELRDLYLVNQRELILATIGPFVLGPNQLAAGSPGIVPAGELWYVWQFGTRIQTSAVQTATVACAFNTNGVPLLCGDFVSIPINSDSGCFAVLAPFWLKGGDSLGLVASAVAGAPSVAMYALITRLRA